MTNYGTLEEENLRIEAQSHHKKLRQELKLFLQVWGKPQLRTAFRFDLISLTLTENKAKQQAEVKETT